VKKDIKILLVDDHELVRRGLRRVLESEEDMEVVGECANGEEALLQVETLSPDMVLMDIKMPGMSGVEATRRLKEKEPACKIIMLTLYDDYMAESIEAGADNYILKDVNCAGLLQVIRQTYQSTTPLEKGGASVRGLDLIIPPPADIAQVMGFIAQVEKTLDAGIRQTIGSREQGTTITLELKSSPLAVLLHKLRSIPNVARVEEKTLHQLPAKRGFFNRPKAEPRVTISSSSRKQIMVTLI